MADHSAIEWTDATWNPIVGCSIVSPGCTHCYAMGMAARIEAMTAALRKQGKTGAPHYAGTTRKVNGNAVWTGKLALAPEAILLEPLRWARPRRIFVNSMGDLFHEDVPDEWIDRVFAVMALAPHHTFQVLTKRAKRMREYFAFKGSQQLERGGGVDKASAKDRIFIEAMLIANRLEAPHEAADWVLGAMEHWPLPNVWLGVSAERQQEADERILELLATPAAIRFVSAEPLLGPLALDAYLKAMRWGIDWSAEAGGGSTDGVRPGLDWIIVGGESGPDARPMHPAWARSIRDQAQAAGVPFFFKQWGAWGLEEPVVGGHEQHAIADDGTLYRSTDLAYPDGKRRGEAIRAHHDQAQLHSIYRVGKKLAGRLLDGVEHNGMPEAR